MTLQSIGTAPDLTVPSALNLSGAANDKVRSDVTIGNVGASALSGDFLYLYSDGAFAARQSISLAAGATQVVVDPYTNLGNGALLDGPIRFRIATGAAGDLVSAVRSLRILPNGGSCGYSERGLSGANSLGANASATLFLGARDADVSVFGIYSPNGGTGTLTLLAPDGTVRGTRAFDLVQNASLVFNPAASAFGVAAEPGDVIRVAVTQGAVQPYAHILDATSRDVAESTPAFASDDVVFPMVGTVIGASGLSFITDVFLSNPGTTAANLSIAYYPYLVQGVPLVAPLTLAPGESRVLQSFLSEVFGITSGQGSILIASSAPIAAAARIAARSVAGDYAGFAPGIPGPSGIANASAIFLGLPQTGVRRTNLVLYNRGFAGTIQITGYRADGTATQTTPFAIGDHVSARIESVFEKLGVSNQPGGRIRVDVPEGMNLYAWTAEVDGVTGDVDLAAQDRTLPLQ
jgi:hypothetical protein